MSQETQKRRHLMEAYVPAVVKSYNIFILPWTENGDGGVGNVIIPHGVPTTLTTLTTFKI